jgi:hypothetical protein
MEKKSLIVQLFVPTAGNDGRIGTAYPVGPNVLLTAAHVIGDAKGNAVQARWWHQSAESGWINCGEVLWDGRTQTPPVDVVLLRCEFPVPVRSEWGRVTDARPNDESQWSSEGFPFVGERWTKPVPLRGLTHSLGDNSAHFHLSVSAGADTEEGWQGASGSPVFVNERIIGVIVTSPQHFNAKRLEAVPLFRLLANTEFRTQIGFIGDAELVAREAKRRAEATSRARIDSERKYVEPRYVDREGFHHAFEAFMRQDKCRCFLVIGKAGAGKTTALSHLALHKTSGPALFIRGGIDDYSKEGVFKLIEMVLVDPAAAPGTAARTVKELLEALRATGQQLVIFIDAINETEFEKIKERRDQLQLLLEHINDLPVRLVVSCRDVFWTYFTHPQGRQGVDFWWQYVYDPTYQPRLSAEITRLEKELEEHLKRANRPPDKDEVEKPSEDIRKQAIQRTEHYPSALIGDFTSDELKLALGRYHLTADDNTQLRSHLQHPLLLQLCSEILAENKLDQTATLSLESILRRYVEIKLRAVQAALHDYNTSAADHFLQTLTHHMRQARYGKIDLVKFDELIGTDRDLQALSTYLLNEGIILEHKSERLVGFQFDTLFEYMLGREIANDFDAIRGQPSAFDQAVRHLIDEAEQFESMVGALEFFCVGLEGTHQQECVAVLRQFAMGGVFAKSACLRILPRLRNPKAQGFVSALETAFRDPGVSRALSLATISAVFGADLKSLVAFSQALIKTGQDEAVARISDLIGRKGSLGLAERVLLAVELLRCPSRETAVATLEEVDHLLRRATSTAAGPNLPADFQPFFDALTDEKTPYVSVLLATEGLLPRHVDSVPQGLIGRVVRSLLRRPQFNMIIDHQALPELVNVLLGKKSNDLLEIITSAECAPHARYMPTLFLYLPNFWGDERNWLISRLIKHHVRNHEATGIGWILLLTIASNAKFVEGIAQSLEPDESKEMWQMLSGYGIYPGYARPSPWKRAAAAMSMALLVAIVYSFLCSPLIGGTDRADGPHVVTVPRLAACAGLMVCYGLAPVLHPRLIRRGWLNCGAISVLIVLVVLFHPLWFTSALACVLTAIALRPFFTNYSRLGLFHGLRVLGVASIPPAAFGLLAARPIEWLALVSQWAVASSVIVLVVTGIRLLANGVYILLLRFAPFYVLMGFVFTLLCVTFGAAQTGSASDLIALSLSVTWAQIILSYVMSEHSRGVLRGFAGSVHYVVLAFLVLATGVFALLALWTWVLAILVMCALLLMPVSDIEHWLHSRVEPMVGGLLGALFGLLIWATWNPSDGLPALFCTMLFWFVFASPRTWVLSIQTLVVENLLRRQLDKS